MHLFRGELDVILVPAEGGLESNEGHEFELGVDLGAGGDDSEAKIGTRIFLDAAKLLVDSSLGFVVVAMHRVLEQLK